MRNFNYNLLNDNNIYHVIMKHKEEGTINKFSGIFQIEYHNLKQKECIIETDEEKNEIIQFCNKKYQIKDEDLRGYSWMVFTEIIPYLQEHESTITN